MYQKLCSRVKLCSSVSGSAHSQGLILEEKTHVNPARSYITVFYAQKFNKPLVSSLLYYFHSIIICGQMCHPNLDRK